MIGVSVPRTHRLGRRDRGRVKPAPSFRQDFCAGISMSFQFILIPGSQCGAKINKIILLLM
jgi:hypothetical protein